MATRMFNTNTAEVTADLSEKILRQIDVLREATADLERVVRARNPTDAIPYGWVQNVLEPFESIKAGVCQINGAVLIRATD